MRTIQWLVGASFAAMGLVAACSDSSSDNPPVADAGTDTSVPDTYVPPVDTGAPDTGTDTAPPACEADADLATLTPNDAALGDSSVGSCVSCARTSCPTQLTACQADCDCTNAVACFYDCIGQPGGSLLGCSQQCNADIQSAGPTQDALLCVACGCTTDCNVPAQIAKAVCGSAPTDAGTDSATDAGTDAAADAADGG